MEETHGRDDSDDFVVVAEVSIESTVEGEGERRGVESPVGLSVVLDWGRG